MLVLTTDDVTTGEITRNLQALREEFKEGFKDLTSAVEKRPDWEDLQRHGQAVNARIDAETAIRELERKTADKAIKALEDWNKWALRTVGAAVLVATTGWVIGGGLIPA